MTTFKGLIDRVLSDGKNGYIVSFITADKNAAQSIGQIKGDEFQTVEVCKFREKRSLNANAYFHVLCGKIAEINGTTMDDIKHRIVLDYGTPYSDEKGEKVFVRLPKSVNIRDIYEYAKWIGDSKDTKKPCSDYLLYKPTHTLNTAEMARLIDGTIAEAIALNIETRTPDEIAEMLSRWEKDDSTD